MPSLRLPFPSTGASLGREWWPTLSLRWTVPLRRFLFEACYSSNDVHTADALEVLSLLASHDSFSPFVQLGMNHLIVRYPSHLLTQPGVDVMRRSLNRGLAAKLAALLRPCLILLAKLSERRPLLLLESQLLPLVVQCP